MASCNTEDPLAIRASVRSSPYAIGTETAGIKWTPNLREVRISLENDTDVAYTNLDFNIQIDTNVLARGHDDSLDVIFDDNEVMVTQKLP